MATQTPQAPDQEWNKVINIASDNFLKILIVMLTMVSVATVNASDFTVQVPVEIRQAFAERARIVCAIVSNENPNRVSRPGEKSHIAVGNKDFELSSRGSFSGIITVEIDYPNGAWPDIKNGGFPPITDAETYVCGLELELPRGNFEYVSCERLSSQYSDDEALRLESKRNTACQIGVQGRLPDKPGRQSQDGQPDMQPKSDQKIMKQLELSE